MGAASGRKAHRPRQRAELAEAAAVQEAAQAADRQGDAGERDHRVDEGEDGKPQAVGADQDDGGDQRQASGQAIPLQEEGRPARRQVLRVLPQVLRLGADQDGGDHRGGKEHAPPRREAAAPAGYPPGAGDPDDDAQPPEEVIGGRPEDLGIIPSSRLPRKERRAAGQSRAHPLQHLVDRHLAVLTRVGRLAVRQGLDLEPDAHRADHLVDAHLLVPVAV